MGNFKPYAFSFLGGILYALGFPSALGKSLLVTPILGMAILLYYLFAEKGLKAKAGLILSFSLSFNLVGFYWIADTLAEFGQLPYFAALLLSLLFTFIIAPYLWALLPIVHFGLQSPQMEKKRALYPALFALAIAALFTFIEYFTPQQFPAMIGQPWAAVGRHLGFANIGGIPIYSFFSFLIIMEIVHAIGLKRFSKFNIFVILVFIFSNPFARLDNPPEDKEKLNMRLVQANISNFLKVDSESGAYASVSQVLERYKKLSLQPYPHGELHLIIWPETAYPFAIESNKSDFAKTEIPSIFQDIALEHQSALFIGGYDTVQGGQGYYQSEYNSNFHINKKAELEDVYHKHILIPFGETLPFGPFNETFSKYLDNISFFSEGKRFPLFKTHTGHTFI
ncbi:MAG: apolipoprotein N-acyltransferase, partial [Bacteriovoracaceae bacterium]